MSSQKKNDTWQKVLKFCDYQERSTQEVKGKLKKLGVADAEQEVIIDALKTAGYLDEERFARSFARSKFLYNKWGWIKIELHLKNKGVPEEIIEKAGEEIDPEKYEEIAADLAEKKQRELKPGEGQAKNQQKIWRFLAQRGFDPETIRKVMPES